MNPLADELDSPARAIARGSDAHSTAAAATATSNSSPSPVAVDSPNLSTGFTTPPAAVVPAAVSTPPTVVVPPPAAAGVDALKRAADGDYSPATVRYALHLGLTPEIDTELLWVAEQVRGRRPSTARSLSGATTHHPYPFSCTSALLARRLHVRLVTAVPAMPRAPDRFPRSARTATRVNRGTPCGHAQALNAPLPPNWSEDVTDDGTVFFRNSLTGAVNWAHPLDDHFRGLIVKLKVRHPPSPRSLPTLVSSCVPQARASRGSVGNSAGICERSSEQT